MKKRGRKPGVQLMKNFLNLIRKQGKPIICCIINNKKSHKSSYKNGEKNRILIKNRDKISKSFELKAWA